METTFNKEANMAAHTVTQLDNGNTLTLVEVPVLRSGERSDSWEVVERDTTGSLCQRRRYVTREEAEAWIASVAPFGLEGSALWIERAAEMYVAEGYEPVDCEPGEWLELCGPDGQRVMIEAAGEDKITIEFDRNED